VKAPAEVSLSTATAMLTSVEVVSVVLGVLPLAIEAFDRGKSIWKTNKEFVSRRRPVENLLRELRLQSVLLEHRLSNALASVSIDGSADIGTLVTELRKDENVNLLEQFMGKNAYISYCYEVEACADVLAKITHRVEGLLPVSLTFPSPPTGHEVDYGCTFSQEQISRISRVFSRLIRADNGNLTLEQVSNLSFKSLKLKS
jgi:hypothetical protein